MTKTWPLAVLALLLWTAAPAGAERVITGFAGAAPNGRSGILDLAQGVGARKSVWGVSVGRVGNVFGWELDASASPGFFSNDAGLQLVTGSQASIFMVNSVLTAPRQWTGSTIRPYGVLGAGVMKARVDDVYGLFPTETVLAGFNAGGGVLVFPWPKIGIRADARYFRSRRQDDVEATLGFGPAYLDLWRVVGGAVLRF